MKYYNKIDELIGKTPLLKVNNLMAEEGLKSNLFVKLEYLNPAGSVKDRAALYMLNDAEKKGELKKGGTVIEPTSGNTGIGLAAIGASRGYKVILTMPDTMSVERISLLKAYGAEVVLTKGELGMKGAIEKAEELKENTPNSIIPSQFDNPSNIDAHYNTTGVEILEDLDGKVDIFVAGIGSGGTVSGVGKILKEKNKDITVIGVEPLSSPLISKGVCGAHKIQGIGANFIPENYKSEYVDKVVAVSNEDSFKYARLIAKKEGVLVGISSGAALTVGIELAKKESGKNIVVLLPDTGDRYLSTELFK